jgi:hypothetical protein
MAEQRILAREGLRQSSGDAKPSIYLFCVGTFYFNKKPIF